MSEVAPKRCRCRHANYVFEKCRKWFFANSVMMKMWGPECRYIALLLSPSLRMILSRTKVLPVLTMEYSNLEGLGRYGQNWSLCWKFVKLKTSHFVRRMTSVLTSRTAKTINVVPKYSSLYLIIETTWRFKMARKLDRKFKCFYWLSY